MSTVLFDTYETAFRTAITRLNHDGGRYSSALTDATDALRSMALAVSDSEEASRPSLRLRHAACNSMLKSVEKAVLISDKTASNKLADERAAARARVNAVTGLHQLEKAQRVLAETEQVASETLDSLAEQRTQIESTRQSVTVMRKDLDRSGRYLDRMGSWWLWCHGLCAGHA